MIPYCASRQGHRILLDISQRQHGENSETHTGQAKLDVYIRLVGCDLRRLAAK